MQPLLNYTPQVYEAIIAALIVVGLIQSFALRRKWHQAEKLKSTVKTVITEAAKAGISGAIFGSLQVAKARAETRRVTDAADRALDAASDVIRNLTEQVEALREENQESRLDDVEQRLSDLENDDDGAGETSGARSPLPLSPFGFPFESPGPLAGGHTDHPLDALFASLGRNGFTPTGRRADRGAPSIKAFKITPDGLVPVNTPADFGLSAVSTSTRPDPSHRTPSLADILSLLSTLPPSPPSPRRTSAFPPDFGVPESPLKADLSGGHGDAYADMADAARAGMGETEACDTQRAPEPQTASPEPQTASPVAGGAEPPLGRRPSRARDLDAPYQSPRAG